MQPTTEHSEGFDRAVKLATDVLYVALGAYCAWLYLPESVKMEVRKVLRDAIHGARVPFDAAAADRKARAEMMADIIELAHVRGVVPAEWVAS